MNLRIKPQINYNEKCIIKNLFNAKGKCPKKYLKKYPKRSFSAITKRINANIACQLKNKKNPVVRINKIIINESFKKFIRTNFNISKRMRNDVNYNEFLTYFGFVESNMAKNGGSYYLKKESFKIKIDNDCRVKIVDNNQKVSYIIREPTISIRFLVGKKVYFSF